MTTIPLILLALLSSAASAPLTTDPDLARGIRMVEQGEYAQAIVVLDGTSRRLGAEPKRKVEAAQAYLNLGIAYVGEGQDRLARAAFREALTRTPGLTLNAFDASPKVGDVFQAARDEFAAETRAAAAVRKGGGGAKKALLVVGGLAVAGGGVAAAAAKSNPGTPEECKNGTYALVSQSVPNGSTLRLGDNPSVAFTFDYAPSGTKAGVTYFLSARLWRADGGQCAGPSAPSTAISFTEAGCTRRTDTLSVPVTVSLGCQAPFTIDKVSVGLYEGSAVGNKAGEQTFPVLFLVER